MRQIKVGMVVFPGFQLLDIAGPKDAFAEVAVLSRGECVYEMLTVGTTRGTVTSSSGLAIVPDCTIFDPSPDFDLVIMPGGHGIFDAYDNPALSAWLEQQYKRDRRVAAICNGIFALGSAGLIDNRAVTTHWMDVPRLAATFPKARIEPDKIYIKDGHIYSTAGVMAGIDLSLAIIEEDFSRKLALDVAKYLIINLRREGWQSQLSPLLECEIVLERQVDALMRSAIEHSGAERGLLILQRGGKQRITAEASSHSDAVSVQLQDAPVTDAMLPQSVVHHVVLTQESVILEDAASDGQFSADPDIRERQARSILCEPLITQTKLVGVLYLENNLAPGVFVPGRVATLKLLASQAAIALENARLIRDLGEREAKVRRLVDANIIGIFIWELGDRIIEANAAFLRLVGYDREDLALGRVHRTELTPPEWRDLDARNAAELKLLGTVQPFETEYSRKDGSRAPVLIGYAAIDEQHAHGVGFVLDLTERKRSEQERDKLRSDLAYMSRVTTMGELAASFAHEIKQPITAAMIDAKTCQRWLEHETPNFEEARKAVSRMITDVSRIADIIDRNSSLYMRHAPKREMVNLNELIREMMVLLQDKAQRHSTRVRSELDAALTAVPADRVQIQQVVLNLMLNGIEAMKDMKGELTVVSKNTGDGEILVKVADSGIGLPAENAESIFDPFFTTKAQGTGMGLSISRRIIESHDGRLWATGNSGPGATFHFTLPTSPTVSSRG